MSSFGFCFVSFRFPYFFACQQHLSFDICYLHSRRLHFSRGQKMSAIDSICCHSVYKALQNISTFMYYSLPLGISLQSGANKSTARIGDGPILTLEKLERQQAGVYQCTADNGVGDPVTVDMRLDVLCKCKLINSTEYLMIKKKF